MTKEERLAIIEKQLKDKRHAYNQCRNFAKRCRLDYEIGCLYELKAKVYNEEE